MPYSTLGGREQEAACVRVHLAQRHNNISYIPKAATKARREYQQGDSWKKVMYSLTNFYTNNGFGGTWQHPSHSQIQSNPKLSLFPLTVNVTRKYEQSGSTSSLPTNAPAVRYEATHGFNRKQVRAAILSHYITRWVNGWRPASVRTTTTTTRTKTTPQQSTTTANASAPAGGTSGGSSTAQHGNPGGGTGAFGSMFTKYIPGLSTFEGWMNDGASWLAGATVWSLNNPILAGIIITLSLIGLAIIGYYRRIRRTWTAMLAWWSRFLRGTVWVTSTTRIGTVHRLQQMAASARRSTLEAESLVPALDAQAVKPLREDEPPRPGDDLWYRITASDTPPSPDSIKDQLETLPTLTDGVEIAMRATPPRESENAFTETRTEDDQDGQSATEGQRAIEFLVHFLDDDQTSTLDRTKHNHVRQAFGGDDFDVEPVSTNYQRLLRATPYQRCRQLLGDVMPTPSRDSGERPRAGSPEVASGSSAVADGGELNEPSPEEQAKAAASIPDAAFQEVLNEQFEAVCPEPPVSYPIGSKGTRRWDFLQRLNTFDETAAEQSHPLEPVFDTLLETDEPAILRAHITPAGDLSDLIRQKLDIVEGEESTQFDKLTDRRGKSRATPSSGDRTTEERRAAARERESGRVRGEVAGEEGTRDEELAAKGARRSFTVTMDVFTQPSPFANDAFTANEMDQISSSTEDETQPLDQPRTENGDPIPEIAESEDGLTEPREADNSDPTESNNDLRGDGGIESDDTETPEDPLFDPLASPEDPDEEQNDDTDDEQTNDSDGDHGSTTSEEQSEDADETPNTDSDAVAGTDENGSSDEEARTDTPETPTESQGEGGLDAVTKEESDTETPSKSPEAALLEKIEQAAASHRTTARDDAWRLAKAWAGAADGEFNQLTKPPEHSRLAKWARTIGWDHHTLGRLRDAYRFERAQQYTGRTPAGGLHYSLRRRWPVVVAAADELPTFAALPSTSAVSDDLAGHMERQFAHVAPLPGLPPSQDATITGQTVEGATIGYALSPHTHARDLDRPVKHRTDFMDRSILHQGLPGTGKSVDQSHEILERRRSTDGPIIIFAGPGANVGDLAARELLAEYGADWMREHVHWFDMPKTLPGLTVFDIRPSLAAKAANGDPTAAISSSTIDETAAADTDDIDDILAKAEETSGGAGGSSPDWSKEGSQIMQLVRKLAELNMGEADFQNARISRDVLQAYGTAGFSPHLYPTTVDGTPAYKRWDSDDSGLPTVDDLVNRRGPLFDPNYDPDNTDTRTKKKALMPFRWGVNAHPYRFALYQFQEQMQDVSGLTSLMHPDIPGNPKDHLPEPGSYAVRRNMETPFDNQQHTAEQIIGGVINRLNALSKDDRLAPLFNNQTRTFSFADFLAGDRKNDVLIFDVENLEPRAQQMFTLTLEAMLDHEINLYKPHLKEASTDDNYYVSIFIDEAGRLVDPSTLADMLAVGRNHSISLSLAVQTPDQLFDDNQSDPASTSPTYAEIVGNIQTTVLRASEVSDEQAEALCPAGIEVEDFKRHLRDLPAGHRLVQYPTPSDSDTSRAQTIEVGRIPLPDAHPNAETPPSGYDSREDFEETYRKVKTDVLEQTAAEYGIPEGESEAAAREQAVLAIPDLAHHLTLDDPLLPLILVWTGIIVTRDDHSPPQGPPELREDTSEDEPPVSEATETRTVSTADDTNTPRRITDAGRPPLDGRPDRSTDQEPSRPHYTVEDTTRGDSTAEAANHPPVGDYDLSEYSNEVQQTFKALANDMGPEKAAEALFGENPPKPRSQPPGENRERDHSRESNAGQATSRRETEDSTHMGEEEAPSPSASSSDAVEDTADAAESTPEPDAHDGVETDGTESTAQARISAVIERMQNPEDGFGGHDPFDGSIPFPGIYSWGHLETMYRRLCREVPKIFTARDVDPEDRVAQRQALPGLDEFAEEVNRFGTIVSDDRVAANRTIPTSDGLFELDRAKHHDDISRDDGLAVRLTPEGARLLFEYVYSTGWAATAGTDTHDTGLLAAVTALEEADPSRVTGTILDQDTAGIPDAELFVLPRDAERTRPEEVIPCTVEMETEPSKFPMRKLRNLRKALNAAGTASGDCRLPIFVADLPHDAAAGTPKIGPAKSLANMLREPMNTNRKGTRYYTQRNRLVTVEGGAEEGGTTAVVPKQDAQKTGGVWIPDPSPESSDCLLVPPSLADEDTIDEEKVYARVDTSTVTDVKPSDCTWYVECPSLSSQSTIHYRVKRTDRNDSVVQTYETREEFEEEWSRVKKPFVPEAEFAYPNYTETAFAILVRYELPGVDHQVVSWWDHREATPDDQLKPVGNLIDAIVDGEFKPASAGSGNTPDVGTNPASEEGDETEATNTEAPTSPQEAETTPEPADKSDQSSEPTEEPTAEVSEPTEGDEGMEEESVATEPVEDEPVKDEPVIDDPLMKSPEKTEEQTDNDDSSSPTPIEGAASSPEDGGRAATAAFVASHIRVAPNSLVDIETAFDRCTEYASDHSLVPPESPSTFAVLLDSLFGAFDTDTAPDGDLLTINDGVTDLLEEGFTLGTTAGEDDQQDPTHIVGVALVDPEETETSLITDADPERAAGGAAFIAGLLESDPDEALPSSEAYDAYVDTATDLGFEPIPDRGPSMTFKRFIQVWGAALFGVSIEQKRQRIDGERRRCYTNINWRG